MREYYRSAASFEKYRSRIILMGLFVFLFHGAKLNSNIIGIDTEDIIKLQGDFYGGWLTTGRQGLVLLKSLLGGFRFNPYFAGLMTLPFLAAAVSAFFLIWDKAALRRGHFAGWCLGGFLWITHPVMTEQLYFSLQSVEICIGIGLTALSLYLTVKWAHSRRKLWFAAGGLLLVLTFSLYQSFVVLYIFGTLTILLLQGIGDEETDAAGILRGRLLPHIAVFVAAFAVNTVITGLFFGSSGYLQGQVIWGKAGLGAILRAIMGHMVKVCTGYGSIYYTFGYGALCVLTAVLFAAVLRRQKHSRGKRVLLLFFLFSLFFSPFLMTVICGGAPAVRSQLVLPAMTGFLGYFDVYLWQTYCRRAMWQTRRPHRTMWTVTAVIVAVVCAFTGTAQLQTTMRLYYTDRLRYEQDAAMGRALITRLEQVRGQEQFPVIVIGKKEFEGNSACVAGEVIGRSFFDYDTEVEPVCFWSTRRILGFLYILGKDYAMVSQVRTAEAMEYSTYMPEWPAEGSVKLYDGMIVVKLSHYE